MTLPPDVSPPPRNFPASFQLTMVKSGQCVRTARRDIMGRGILLWLLGIPIPIIILIMLFVR
ncbi:hypothetical protein C8J36_103145 [Rhizobium sp. PP-F2F-G48]|nr:hypothetical protein C8J36_103145 [Rhizobium sp. PP-F2F-G48]